jgi:hypothetical protein
MQLIPVSSSLLTSVKPARRKPQTSSDSTRARLKSGNQFEPLLQAAFNDFVEAEYEELQDEGGKSKNHKYLATLFPEFMLKSRYVDYYL